MRDWKRVEVACQKGSGCEGQGEEDYIIIIMEREEGILEYSYEMKVEIAKEKLRKMRVLIVGARGLGIQIAKNLMMTGIQQLSIFDPSPMQTSTLTSTRAASSILFLSTLSTTTTLTQCHSIVPDLFDCVIVTDNFDQQLLSSLNLQCRQKNIKFIYCASYFLFGFCFVDFGDRHEVWDETGEVGWRSQVVVGIKRNEVFLHNERVWVEKGEFVEFLVYNGTETVWRSSGYEVVGRGCGSLEIGKGGEEVWERWGRRSRRERWVMREYKAMKTYSFRSFKDSILDPITDPTSLPHQQQGRFQFCHLLLLSFLSFHKTHQRLPNLLNQSQSETFSKIFQQHTKNFPWAQKPPTHQQILTISKCSQTQIAPCASFWGGIVTQEVMKLAGRGRPICSWFHYDFMEVYKGDMGMEIDKVVENSRERDCLVVFGKEGYERIKKARFVLEGAGTVGCEFLKVAALMGLATQGQIICMDDREIHKSLLNNQFMFRETDIGQPQSTTAATFTKHHLNPNINLTVLPNTSLQQLQFPLFDFAICLSKSLQSFSTLSNLSTHHKKPFFQAGCLGDKCSCTSIIPYQTKLYKDQQDVILYYQTDLSTSKNFPLKFQHAVDWEVREFQRLFGMEKVMEYKKDPVRVMRMYEQRGYEERWIWEELCGISEVVAVAVGEGGKGYEGCVGLAVRAFQGMFVSNIQALVESFPKEKLMENGKLFWSGCKVFPEPVYLDLEQPFHVRFLRSTANLYAKIIGIPKQQDPQLFKTMVINTLKTQTPPPRFQNSATLNLLHQSLSQQIQHLPSSFTPLSLSPESDEHIQFLYCASNLRSQSYSLGKWSKQMIELRVRRQPPAQIACAAAVAGVLALEVVKKVVGIKQTKNWYMNFGAMDYVWAEPPQPVGMQDREYDPVLMGPVKAVPKGWTCWDEIVIHGPMTVEELIDYFREKYAVRVMMISVDGSQHLMYCAYFRPEKRVNVKMGVLEAAEYQTLKSYGDDFLVLEIYAELIQGQVDTTMPRVIYYI